MGKVELALPKMGESVAEATIIKWLRNEGDTVEAEEPILEIATDKVDSEVPAPSGGILIKQLFDEGSVAKVGEIIAILETDGSVEPSAKQEVKQEIEEKTSSPSKKTHSIPTNPSKDIALKATPLAKKILDVKGIGPDNLANKQGSGANGKFTKKDVLELLEGGPNKTENQTPTLVSLDPNGGDEIIEMDRMRRLISDHMVMSKQVSPHVTSMVEADVTNIVNWRNKVKDEFAKREGEKITFTPIFIEAIAKAIKDLPMINISVDGTNIVVRKDINVGMATALPTGNLIVPVIKQADRLNLVGLTKSVNELANKARNNQLSPDDIQGGTFTITNVGSFGNVTGMPIINQPQVAILAVGAIKKQAAVIETPEGDTIGIRSMMYLSLSYDHRVVDGALGGSFLRKVADYLEQFNPNREI